MTFRERGRNVRVTNRVKVRTNPLVVGRPTTLWLTFTNQRWNLLRVSLNEKRLSGVREKSHGETATVDFKCKTRTSSNDEHANSNRIICQWISCLLRLIDNFLFSSCFCIRRIQKKSLFAWLDSHVSRQFSRPVRRLPAGWSNSAFYLFNDLKVHR